MEDDIYKSDLDIASAAGWDPDKKWRDELLEKAKKKNPRYFNPIPEIIGVRPASHFLSKGRRMGQMEQHFGPFWHKGEIAVLYSPPGTGKSALAVQIAESIARGVPIKPFDTVPPKDRIPPMRALYVDFEMNRQQFANRYTLPAENGRKLEKPYRFSKDLLRAVHYWNGSVAEGYKDFSDMLFADLERTIGEEQVGAVILDNITFLSMRSHANSDVAIRLMEFIRQLRNSCFVSVLIIAHTPKHSEHKPLTMNHLQGAVDIAKIADSMFALGRSALDGDLRYLKQIKSRSGRIEYESDNVLVYRLEKFDHAAAIGIAERTAGIANFLGFNFIGVEDERLHIAATWHPGRAKQKRSDRRIITYAQELAAKGLSAGAIAKKLGIGRSTAHRYIQQRAKRDGQKKGCPT